MLELARNALFYFTNLITFDRFLTILEINVIAVAAVFAYKVGRKQNQINENLLGLHLVPRITVTCNHNEEEIYISNQGGSTVNVWGFKGVGFNEKIHDEPVTIEPNTSIKVKVSKLFQIGKNKKIDSKESIYILVSAIDGKKYKLKTTIHFDFVVDELKDVRAQNHPIDEWVE